MFYVSLDFHSVISTNTIIKKNQLPLVMLLVLHALRQHGVVLLVHSLSGKFGKEKVHNDAPVQR